MKKVAQEPNKPQQSKVIETTNIDFVKVKKLEENHNIIFKPNDGPQTDFLAASEREVLYGGSAGGDAIVNFNNRVTNFCMGLDNNGDVFRICNSSEDLSTNTRLTITEAGLVGIGADVPAEKLELRNGKMRLSN